eukprot:618629-Prymnesium_polylepis.2
MLGKGGVVEESEFVLRQPRALHGGELIGEVPAATYFARRSCGGGEHGTGQHPYDVLRQCGCGEVLQHGKRERVWRLGALHRH